MPTNWYRMPRTFFLLLYLYYIFRRDDGPEGKQSPIIRKLQPCEKSADILTALGLRGMAVCC